MNSGKVRVTGRYGARGVAREALERRTSRVGRNPIHHPPSGHDDRANSVCGVLEMRCARRNAQGSPIGFGRQRRQSISWLHIVAGSKWQPSGLVFTSSIGTALDERNVRRRFKELLQAAELPGRMAARTRHTTATLLLGQGVHPRVVMDTLGRSQISLTLDTFARPAGPSGGGREAMDMAIGCQIGCQARAVLPPRRKKSKIL